MKTEIGSVTLVALIIFGTIAGCLLGHFIYPHSEKPEPTKPTPGCWFDDPSPGYYTVSVQRSDSTNRYTFNQVKEVKLGWGNNGMK